MLLTLSNTTRFQLIRIFMLLIAKLSPSLKPNPSLALAGLVVFLFYATKANPFRVQVGLDCKTLLCFRS